MSDNIAAPPVSPSGWDNDKQFIYKVVLTGGPCAGKTTTVARLRTFFENLGWKVYTVHEAATILLGGGVKFSDVTLSQARRFQLNILRTILQLERTFFEMASEDKGNVLIVCDRGTMDPSACEDHTAEEKGGVWVRAYKRKRVESGYEPTSEKGWRLVCSEEEWQTLISEEGWDSVQLRDARYDQIIHMVTAANGAETFYQLANNTTRSEGFELARDRDAKAAQAWVGHPYFDTIDNTTDFESKIRRVIEAVCKRLGKRLRGEFGDRLQAQAKKRKFLMKLVPDIKAFPRVQDFDVQHDYLLSSSPEVQSRMRKRGQRGHYMYTLTDRRLISGEKVEQIRHISSKEYQTLFLQRDPNHYSIYKTRRCFLWKGHYFQLDIFKESCSERCRDLVLMETYTTRKGDDLEMPDFLDVEREVTGDPEYSMFNLSAKTTNERIIS